MRKQVDYEFRLMMVSAVDPNAGRGALNGLIREYLQSGWELLRAETVTYEANNAFIAYHFVKYEDVEVSAKSASK